jgi:protoheme IX farnesyltransferase
MLPNVAGLERTRLEILLYTLVLAPLGLAPWLLGFASPVYGVVAMAGGLMIVNIAARMFSARDAADIRRAAGRMFGFSILYLFGLFLVLVIERALHLLALI